MRNSALHRNISIIAVAFAAAALSSIAVMAGSIWAVAFIVALATMAGLEFSARHGKAATSTVTQESLLQQLSRPIASTTDATPHSRLDAMPHSLDERRQATVTELPEDHLATVVQVDFRRRCAA